MRRGETEHNAAFYDEVLAAEVRLGNVEAEAEGYQGLVDHHSNEDVSEVGRFVLESNGYPLEHRVEGESGEQHQTAEG